MIPLAVIGSAIIGVILLLFANRKLHESPYLLVVNCADEAAERRRSTSSAKTRSTAS